MNIKLPELSLILLMGASGSGKTTFARKHFKPTEILSSDHCRAMVSDDENDQTVTHDAFQILHFIAAKRLARGRLTVVDATNVQAHARKSLLALGRKYHCLPVAIVFRTSENLCCERNQNRSERNVGEHVIHQQWYDLKKSFFHLKKEGFHSVHILETVEQTDQATITREPMRSDKTLEHGPFDIIGDVHGCFDELMDLLRILGYDIKEKKGPRHPHGDILVSHPQGRKAVFLGDLVDRGPKVCPVLRVVMDMVRTGAAFCVPGDHEDRLMRKLSGKNVKMDRGLGKSLDQLSRESPAFQKKVLNFVRTLATHYVFDDGKLVVAHAGMKPDMQGRASGKVRRFALYGETRREISGCGTSGPHEWTAKYRGKAAVVYGHTRVPEPEWLNRTINIDTGCVFGGKLTALRYPEKEVVSVPARQTYHEPAMP